MANPDHVAWLAEGYQRWNERRKLVRFKPDLSKVDFREIASQDNDRQRKKGFFRRYNFSDADLSGANLSSLDFSQANFSRSNLSRAILEQGIFRRTKFNQADLTGVDASEAVFERASFRAAELDEVIFDGALLVLVDIREAEITDTQLERAASVDGLIREDDFYRRETASKSAPDFEAALPPTAPEKEPTYPVFFATNRKPVFKDNAIVDFGPDRDDGMHYGTAEVVIPQSHKIGSLGSPFWKRWFKGDDKIKLKQLITLNGELYWQTINKAFVGKHDPSPATIFIHGYNTSFSEAVIRAGQIGFDLGLKSGIGLFSWPSKGTLLKYPADEAAVEASRDYLAQFIVSYFDNGDVKSLNLIGHSMGCRCLVAALEQIALKNPEILQAINQIIFAAADVDQGVMNLLGQHTTKNSGRTTSYACPDDVPLGASGWLHSYHRVGLLPPVFIYSDIDTVTVEKTKLLDLGHGYFAGAKNVLSDMFQLIKYSAAPKDRSFVEEAGSSPEIYWRLKE